MTLTLKCIVRIWTSGGLSVDCVSGVLLLLTPVKVEHALIIYE